MGILSTIRAMFSAKLHGISRGAISRDTDTRPTAYCVSTLDDWVHGQISKYSTRDGLGEQLDRDFASYNPEIVGIGGRIVDNLMGSRPRMIPQSAWGAGRSWRSARRRNRWEALLNHSGVAFSSASLGMLVRFCFNPTDWVPHPYVPPSWMTYDEVAFSHYVTPIKEAFRICQRWNLENSTELTRRLSDRLRLFPVRLGAGYFRHDRNDYADVAFVLANNESSLLSLRTVWKRETVLTELVRSVFPDAIREFAPPWLKGQRIDVFVPSVQVAFEYQGEQHFSPVEYFGGKRAFLRTKDRDQRKADACRRAKVRLVVWNFREPITNPAMKW